MTTVEESLNSKLNEKNYPGRIVKLTPEEMTLLQKNTPLPEVSDNILRWLKKQVFKPGVYGKVKIIVENGKVVDLKHEVTLKEKDIEKLLTSC